MDADTLLALDRAHVWHPFSPDGAPDPLPVRSAHGALVTDLHGRDYLDLISSWWVTLHGHAHPALARAIADQAGRLEQVIFAGCTHEPAVELCRRLAELLPAGLDRFFFSDDGSTAVEVALKLALQARRNRGERGPARFLAFQGGYHGDTLGALAVGVSSGYAEPWRDLLFPVDLLPAPATWMGDPCPEAGETAALDALDAHLARHGPATAAAILEPLVQGAGGMRMHRPAFLRGAAQRLRAAGVPLILDEVMTGFGRTGHLFAFQAAGIAPDLLCLSKGLTGGALPMALTVATRALFEAFRGPGLDRAFQHGHSFTASPLGCAAALASLDLLLDPACAQARTRIEARHRHHLARIPGPRTLRPRVQGTVAALDVAALDGLEADLNARMKAFFLDRGLLLRPLGATVYLLPPYCVTDAQLDRAYAAIAEGLAGGF